MIYFPGRNTTITMCTSSNVFFGLFSVFWGYLMYFWGYGSGPRYLRSRKLLGGYKLDVLFVFLLSKKEIREWIKGAN